MRKGLLLNTVLESHDDLLEHVARVLRHLPDSPETLVWSRIPGDTQGRIWMVVDGEEAAINQLADILRGLPGVQLVYVHDPEEAHRLPLPSR